MEMLTRELFFQMWEYSCSKEMRERFLESKLEKKSNEILRAKSVRGSE
jgi:hypothetical protein